MQVCWGKLELNSAGHRPSRTEFGQPWCSICFIQKGIATRGLNESTVLMKLYSMILLQHCAWTLVQWPAPQHYVHKKKITHKSRCIQTTTGHAWADTFGCYTFFFFIRDYSFSGKFLYNCSLYNLLKCTSNEWGKEKQTIKCVALHTKQSKIFQNKVLLIKLLINQTHVPFFVLQMQQMSSISGVVPVVSGATLRDRSENSLQSCLNAVSMSIQPISHILHPIPLLPPSLMNISVDNTWLAVRAHSSDRAASHHSLTSLQAYFTWCMLLRMNLQLSWFVCIPILALQFRNTLHYYLILSYIYSIYIYIICVCCQLIAINRIQNKVFVYIIYVYTVYIYYVYIIQTHACIYLRKKCYVYLLNLFIYNVKIKYKYEYINV